MNKELLNPTLPPKNCTRCGLVVPADSPRELCPRCLLRLAMIDTDSVREQPVGGQALSEGLSQFGDYTLLHELGRGAMGIVYKARQVSLGRLVALKMLTPMRLLSEADLHRFRTEAETVASLDHPNILPLYDFGERKGQPYYTTRLIEMGSLSDHIARGEFQLSHASLRGSSEVRECQRRIARLLMTIARAVDYAHERGVVHRDLKPANLFVDAGDCPYVGDFGLAKILSSQEQLTLTQTVAGTPAYMAPEQAQGGARRVTPATDVYGLGVILYETLTGHCPFVGDTSIATLHQILHDDPVPPRLLNQRVSHDLQTICLKCLARESRHRYGSTRELADDLGRWLDGRTIRARPATWAEKASRWCVRNPAAGALAGTLIALALVSLVVFLRQWRQTLEESRRTALVNSRLTSLVNKLELQRAEDLFRSEEASEGLAYLARMLRQDPSDRSAASRLISTLSLRQYALPQSRPARHAKPIRSAEFSPDGTRFVTASEDGTARIWDAPSGSAAGPPLDHPAVVTWAEFSADGQSVLTACEANVACLWDAATGQLKRTLGSIEGSRLQLSDAGDVFFARFSPDGQKVVTASADGTARIWQSRTGAELVPPMRHGAPLRTARFSPNGRRIATGSSDKKARIWDAQTGVLLVETSSHGGAVVDLQFSPDNSRLVTASLPGNARISDASSGQLLAPPLTHLRGVRSAEFSPDGQWVLTSSIDATAQVWDSRTGLASGPPLKHDSNIRVAHFTRDGTQIVTASDDGTARVWETKTSQPLCEPLVHGAYVIDANFGPDNATVLTASVDGSARIFTLPMVKPYVLLPHDARVTMARFNHAGTQVVTASVDGSARIWDSRSGKPMAPPLRHAGLVYDATFSPFDDLVATVSGDQTARLWNSRTGEMLVTLSGHTSEVVSICFSPDGKRVATVSHDGTGRVWDTSSGEAVGEPIRHSGPVERAAFSPDGATLVTASQDATARLWDTRTTQAKSNPLQHQGWVMQAQFSPDGKRLLTASYDGTVKVWDAVHGAKLVHVLRHNVGVRDATFDPSGKWIAASLRDKTAWIWDVETGKPLIEPIKHAGPVTTVEFGPDGRSLLTASVDGSARIWDVGTGLAVTEPLRHRSIVGAARFSPDGQRVVTASYDGTARIWDVPAAAIPVPAWIPKLAEIVGGERLNSLGILEPVAPGEIAAVQSAIAASPDDSFYKPWVERFFDRFRTR